MEKKKVIVTGGAGFIGSHLAEELVKRGYSTIIFDDLSTGKMENIEGLLKNSNAEFARGSVNNLSLLQEVFKDACYVFHHAALPSVSRSIENPIASHEVNLTGTLNVLIAARDNAVKKVIYASSAAVYGDTPDPVKREDMMPYPLSPYAVDKLAAEYYCGVFNKVYHLPTVCLRYFNVFGPRQDSDSHYSAVVPLFIKRVSQSVPPFIFGDGEQTRDFIFVKDVVEANILAADSDACGIFNISRGESTTINRLAELIVELTGKVVKLVHLEMLTGDIRHSLADISKASALGFQPKHDLKAGLTETIRWFHNG